MTEPKLQKPGAGLPLFEGLFLKHIFMPVTLKIMPWDESHTMFLAQTEKILGLYQAINPQDRAKKILIPRLMGLEDSSRYWSANMTLEHIMIVTKGMTDIILSLDAEKTVPGVISTADVKPKGLSDDDLRSDFWQLMHDCAEQVGKIKNRNSTATHDHPWFGPLNTHGWHSLLPVHHNIHRRQLEKIIAGL
jgi:hypothetical protein